MADDIMAIRAGRLGLSRIVYHCDLQQASGTIIPLGVIAEMMCGATRVLGLVARARLTDQEIQKVGRAYRNQLATPFALLRDDFKWAWVNTGGGTALQILADRYTNSLFFAPPRVEVVRMRSERVRGAANVRKWTIETLRRKRDADFYALLDDKPEPIEMAEAA